jgi:acetyl-CoA carboxylase biotin carboxyl carrier protein
MADFRDLLDDLIARVRGTDIAEIEVRKQGFRISLRRRQPSPGVPGHSGDGAHSAGADPDDAEPNTGEIDIRSPLNGIFYAASSPDEAPFVKLGDEISPGQVVGLVEAMKVFNEIVAEVAGTVSALLIAEGAEVAEGGAVLRVRLADPD